LHWPLRIGNIASSRLSCLDRPRGVLGGAPSWFLLALSELHPASASYGSARIGRFTSAPSPAPHHPGATLAPGGRLVRSGDATCPLGRLTQQFRLYRVCPCAPTWRVQPLGSMAYLLPSSTHRTYGAITVIKRSICAPYMYASTLGRPSRIAWHATHQQLLRSPVAPTSQ